MDEERERRVEELYKSACNLAPDEQRALLDERCVHDAELRREVESLLAHYERAGPDFLDRASCVTEALELPEHGTLRRVGRYQLGRVIASGGMGTVYEATQENPRRVVAVKLMKRGLASKSALRRFEYEAQILGRLRHPGIAQVYEADTHPFAPGLAAGADDLSRDREEPESVPYFAMEYIPSAKPITQYAKEKKLGTRERMKLFAHVCDAVHHGHQKGIVHRDLKPGNILVDSAGQVKIIDFGVARCTDSDLTVTTVQTDVGQLIGTLQYMSPEQCEADPHDIDVRSDVYALGMVFYELLSDRLPYDVTDKPIHEAARLIREEAPTRLSTINKALRGDVETIVLKALEKERQRRYQSAADFGQDIERYLNSEPITARPASALYQIRVFARRNKAVVGAVAVAFVVLIAGLIGTGQGFVQAVRARAEAERRSGQLQKVAEFQASQLSAISPERMGVTLRSGILEKRRGLLAAQNAGEKRIDASLRELETQLAGVNFTDLARETLDEHIFKRALIAIEDDFADQPLVKARLLQTAADTLRALGLLDTADAPQSEALGIRRRMLGDSHPDTLASIGARGRLLQAQGKLDEAESSYREALELARGVLGDDDPKTLTALDSMGQVLFLRGKLAESEPYMRRALEGRRRVLGDRDLATLTSINNVGGLLYRQGKLPEAEAQWREALEAYRLVLGDEDPETLTTLSNLGLLLQEQGKLAEAETYLRESLAGCRRALGDDHPLTLTSIHNVGFVLEAQARFPEAEVYYREALERRRQVLGESHPETLVSMNNMGALLCELGHLDEASALGAEAVQRARRVLPKEHYFTAVFLANYGGTLVAMERFAEAEPQLLEAYDILRAALGTEHPRTLKVRKSIPELYEAWDAAEPGKGYDKEAAEWRTKLPRGSEDAGP